jgi:hypothetical protein
MKELCRKCSGVLFDKVLLDNGSIQINSETGSKVRLEREGEKMFFRCPYCGAKNVTIPCTSKDGLTQRKITHAE